MANNESYDNILSSLKKQGRHHELAEELLASIPEELLNEYPTYSYLRHLFSSPEIGSYKEYITTASNIARVIEEQWGEGMLVSYHKVVLLQLLGRACGLLPELTYPSEIKELWLIEFERISREIEDGAPDECYRISADRFQKDLALCMLRLVPMGARKIHLSAISRKWLLPRSMRNVFDLYRVTGFNPSGYFPFFETHLDKDLATRRQFTPEGHVRTYLRIAKTLELYPKVRGVFGCSWLYDPQLTTVSPEVAYLRRMIEQGGGVFFTVGAAQDALKNATAWSAHRKKLHQEGTYLPKNVLGVWPRKALLAWAKKTTTGREALSRDNSS